MLESRRLVSLNDRIPLECDTAQSTALCIGHTGASCVSPLTFTHSECEA